MHGSSLAKLHCKLKRIELTKNQIFTYLLRKIFTIENYLKGNYFMITIKTLIFKYNFLKM